MEAEFEALKALLEEKNIAFSVSFHDKVHTSEEAAAVRKVPLSSGVKAIVVKSAEGLFLVLVPGDRKVDFSSLPVGKAKLADPAEVFRITGCEVGSVHPFGNLFGLRVFMDRHILDNETVNFSAGTHESSINMDPRDMVEIIKPDIGDYSKGK